MAINLANPTTLAQKVLESLIQKGVTEFCLCPGARNAPLVYPLVHCPKVKIYYWPEERSAAFFALGRMKATGRPVAVITTSGTAVGELLPAVMEAFYTSLPLIVLTADRPKRYRGSGAPQSAEHIGIFSHYVHEMQDWEEGDDCEIKNWSGLGPIHLNVCFEEPKDELCQALRLESDLDVGAWKTPLISFRPDSRYTDFIQSVRYPLVVVGSLLPCQHEAVVRFLLHLKAPVYAEGSSGIREDARLAPFRITRMEKIWLTSSKHGYPIDGILRIGGVPTVRLWRDLEDRAHQIRVCSISEQPFSGLSWMDVIHTSLIDFFAWAETLNSSSYAYQEWHQADEKGQLTLLDLFAEEPKAEPSLFHALSLQIPRCSKIYLGNSLPIREWDLSATFSSRSFQVNVSRGLNGIDGQISTFLGFCTPEQDNWAIIGDLTALYDLVAPWILPQLSISANLVIINNGGSGIFKRMFAHPAFQNHHQLSFEPLAEFWKCQYEKWESIPTLSNHRQVGGRIIEVVPDFQATERFWQKLKEI